VLTLISVLKIGHRPERDKRITTHCALVARAFGCSEFVYTGKRDPALEESVARVSERWGGEFRVRYSNSWRREISNFPGLRVHLTMYGVPFESELRRLKGNVLLVVGGEKVPREVFELADLNLSVTSQPHSEVGALAVVLYAVNGTDHDFPNAKLRIVPSPKGKVVRPGEGSRSREAEGSR